ncbi:MAG: RNA polymerase sigma factor [Planctomycetota bacterium]
MSEPRSTPNPSGEVFLEHADWVRRLAGELVRDPQGADDVAQNTWLAFLTQRPEARAPLRPWLARVVRNQAALRARRRGNARHREATVARDEDIASAASVVERGELQKRIISCVLALHEPYRSVLLLHYYEDRAPAEIARARGQKASTVRSQLTRGRELVRAELDADHGGERARWVRSLAPLVPVRLGARSARLGAPGTLVALAVGVLVLGAVALSRRPSASKGTSVDAPGSGRARTEAVVSIEPTPGPPLATRAPGLVDAARGERSIVLVDGEGRALAGHSVELDGASATADAEGRLFLSDGAHTLEVDPGEGVAVSRVASHGARRTEPFATVRVDIAPDAERVVVPRGPALRVVVDAAPGVQLNGATLFARLGPVNDTAYADHGKPIHVAPLVPATPEPGTASSAFVARFGAEAAALHGEHARLLLEVRDTEGFLAGAAEIALAATSAAAAHRVSVLPTARVDVRVGERTGAVPREARDAAVVHLTAEAGRTVGFASAGEAGDLWLGWVSPGERACTVTVPGYETWRGSVECRAGERTELVVELEPLGVAAGLEGSVTASRAGFDEQLLVFLLDEGGRVRGVDPLGWQERGGARVAAFSFDETPPGSLVVEVVSLESAVTVRPRGLQPVPEARVPILVDLDDASAARDVVVVAVDADTGAPIEAFDFRASLDGGMTRRFLHRRGGGWTLHAGGMRWNDFEGRAPLRRLPRNASVQWTVGAEGFEPVRGTEAEFVEHSGGFSELRVLLERR